jgi:iron complex outermembrane receptor protein
MFNKKSLAVLALSNCAFIPLAAQADMATDTAAASNTALDEVVVTAQRHSENLVSVPISVATASEEKLEATGVMDMGSLAQVVPSLHIDASGAFFMPSIRGVGTAIAGAGASNNVATYVDGAYKPNALSNDFDFVDVTDIQVLKGPQGTLFGRNTTGGAIVVTTRDPTFSPTQEARVSYGSFNTFESAVFLSDAVTDHLAASVSFGATHSNGWITNVVTNQSANPIDDYSGRVKFLYKPTDALDVKVTFDGFRINDPTLYAVTPFEGKSDAALYGVPLTTDPRNVSLGGKVIHIAQGAGVGLKIDYDMDWATFSSLSNGHWDGGQEATNEMAAAFPADGSLPAPGAFPGGLSAANGFGVIITQADWLYHENYETQEFLLSQHGKGPIDWTAGLFYYADSTTYSPFNLNLYGPIGPAGAFVNSGDVHFLSFTDANYTGAFFVDGTYNLDNWHFTAGGRYSRDRATAEEQGFGSDASPVVTGAHDWNSFIPRAVVRYSLTPDSNVYVSFSEGQKAGLYNSSGFLGQPNPLNPERITDVEGGYKITSANWRFEASAFHYNYKDLQVSTYEGGVAFLQNAPSSELYGGDLHLEQKLSAHFNLDFGAAYTHARYTNFDNGALQTFNENGVINGTTNVTGFPMERTPTFTGNIGLNFHTPAFGGEVDLNSNFWYQTKASFDFADTLVQGAYGLLNLRAAWTAPSKKWTFSVTGTNVTDKTYATEVLPNAGGFGATYGKPAAVMVGVNYKN